MRDNMRISHSHKTKKEKHCIVLKQQRSIFFTSNGVRQAKVLHVPEKMTTWFHILKTLIENLNRYYD